MTTALTNDLRRVILPAGHYRATVVRSYGKPGRCRIGSLSQSYFSAPVGGKGPQFTTTFRHIGGDLILACEPGVSPIVELVKIGDIPDRLADGALLGLD